MNIQDFYEKNMHHALYPYAFYVPW